MIYTEEPNMYADPVINKIDPNRAVAFRLYKQDTQVRIILHKITITIVYHIFILFLKYNSEVGAYTSGS